MNPGRWIIARSGNRFSLSMNRPPERGCVADQPQRLGTPENAAAGALSPCTQPRSGSWAVSRSKWNTELSMNPGRARHSVRAALRFRGSMRDIFRGILSLGEAGVRASVDHLMLLWFMGSLDFQNWMHIGSMSRTVVARTVVAQTGSLLYRRLAVGRAWFAGGRFMERESAVALHRFRPTLWSTGSPRARLQNWTPPFAPSV
jgi:hypothetical protein